MQSNTTWDLFWGLAGLAEGLYHAWQEAKAPPRHDATACYYEAVEHPGRRRPGQPRRPRRRRYP